MDYRISKRGRGLACTPSPPPYNPQLEEQADEILSDIIAVNDDDQLVEQCMRELGIEQSLARLQDMVPAQSTRSKRRKLQA